MTKSPTTSFRFDKNTIAQMDVLANAMRCSRAEVIRRALTDYEETMLLMTTALEVIGSRIEEEHETAIRRDN